MWRICCSLPLLLIRHELEKRSWEGQQDNSRHMFGWDDMVEVLWVICCELRGGIAHPFFATASLSNTLPRIFLRTAQHNQFAYSSLTFPIFVCQQSLGTFLPHPTNFSPSPHPDFSLFMMISCPVRSQGSQRKRKGGQITLQQQISSPGLCEYECLADRSAGRYTSYQRHEDRLLFSTGPRPWRQERLAMNNRGG